MSDCGENWYAVDDGCTIGTGGSERGTILVDDEHVNGARITLERDTEIAPFAITCGIYGWMFHTRWFGTAEEAQRNYDAMKQALGAIMQVMARNDDPDPEAKMEATTEQISVFIKRFP